MTPTALELLAELEWKLETEGLPAPPAEDGTEPTLTEWRLWILDALRGHDVEVHLLVDHLLHLVDEPALARVGEWLADLGDVLDPPRPPHGEREGELSALTRVLDRLLRRPPEVRTSAALVILALTLTGEERRFLQRAIAAAEDGNTADGNTEDGNTEDGEPE